MVAALRFTCWGSDVHVIAMCGCPGDSVHHVMGHLAASDWLPQELTLGLSRVGHGAVSDWLLGDRAAGRHRAQTNADQQSHTLIYHPMLSPSLDARLGGLLRAWTSIRTSNGPNAILPLLLLRFPSLVHEKKKTKFKCRHISHRGGKFDILTHEIKTTLFPTILTMHINVIV